MSLLMKKLLSQDELAVVYASLILVDDDLPVTDDKINTLLAAAEVKVESIWPTLYAKAIASRNARQLITSVGGCAAEGAAMVGSEPASGATEVKEEVKPAAPVEEDDEDDSDDDMGLSLFD